MSASSDIAAWVGAATGTAALVWQAATWRRSQHKVLVTVSGAYPARGFPPQEKYVRVQAVNTGAGAVDITGWGIGAEEAGHSYSIDQVPDSTSLPHRLQSGANAIFFMNADDLRRQRHHRAVGYQRMRTWVRLGTDKVVRSRRGVPLKD